MPELPSGVRERTRRTKARKQRQLCESRSDSAPLDTRAVPKAPRHLSRRFHSYMGSGASVLLKTPGAYTRVTGLHRLAFHEFAILQSYWTTGPARGLPGAGISHRRSYTHSHYTLSGSRPPSLGCSVTVSLPLVPPAPTSICDSTSTTKSAIHCLQMSW